MLQTQNVRHAKHIEKLLENDYGREVVVFKEGIKLINGDNAIRWLSFDEMAAIVDYLRTSDKKDDLFEKCWIAYKRKGVKKQSKMQWDKLSNEDKEKVLPHIRAYVTTREIQYQKDFERYLRDKLFNEIVYDKSQIIYDPMRCQEYLPTGFGIYPNEQDKCFYYVGNYSDGDQMFDGYDDSERPNGAQIVLNNGRGTLTWNREQNKWLWKRR